MGLITPLRATSTSLDVHALADAYMPTGAKAQTFSRYGVPLSNAAVVAASGTMNLFSIYVAAGVTVTNINMIPGGTVPTASSHLWVALYTPARALLAQSTDDTSATPLTANTKKTFALSAAQVTTSSGVHYVAFLETVSSGNMPTFDGVLGAIASPLSEAPVLIGESNSGLTTTAPSPANAPAFNNSGLPYIWLT